MTVNSCIIKYILFEPVVLSEDACPAVVVRGMALGGFFPGILHHAGIGA